MLQNKAIRKEVLKEIMRHLAIAITGMIILGGIIDGRQRTKRQTKRNKE